MILTNTGLATISVFQPVQGAASIPKNTFLKTKGQRISNHVHKLFAHFETEDKAILDFIQPSQVTTDVTVPYAFGEMPKHILKELKEELHNDSKYSAKLKQGAALIEDIIFDMELLRTNQLMLKKA